MKEQIELTYEQQEETVHVLTEQQAEQLADAYYSMGSWLFEILETTKYPADN